MADSILLDGDLVNFLPSFGPAIVILTRQVTLKASGADPVFGRKMCVEGDERLASILGCPYTTAQHPIPGTGNVTILQLHPSSVARKTTSLGRKVLLKGAPFVARFQVLAPAMMSLPNGVQVPDSIFLYQGSGSFVSAGPTKQGE